MPTGWEWAILLLIAVLLFGGARLSGIGRDLGRGVREFKQEVAGGEPAVIEPAIEGEPPAMEAESEPMEQLPHSPSSPTNNETN